LGVVKVFQNMLKYIYIRCWFKKKNYSSQHLKWIKKVILRQERVLSIHV